MYFLVGGTQTNATVIDAILLPWQGVIAPNTGHINMHEAGIVERGGHKILNTPAVDGKICAADVERIYSAWEGDGARDHMIAPALVYVYMSQPTEYGTLYSLKELEELSAVCRERDLKLFVDGALLAKGRLLGVQFEALFEDGLYLTIGEPAVEATARIREALKRAGYVVTMDSPTNLTFVALDQAGHESLSDKVRYSIWETLPDGRYLARLYRPGDPRRDPRRDSRRRDDGAVLVEHPRLPRRDRVRCARSVPARALREAV